MMHKYSEIEEVTPMQEWLKAQLDQARDQETHTVERLEVSD